MGPPSSISELLERAHALAGLSLGEVAAILGEKGPSSDRLRTKGHGGELIERALGANAGNLDMPDFTELSVELKTIPLDGRGKVKESTFVCSIDLERASEEEWETSRVWRKLCCVLWMPVQSSAAGPLSTRRLGTPVLWRPDVAQQEQIRADWLLLMGMIAIGKVEDISAHLGEVLQVRPKAKDSQVKVEVLMDGELLRVNPRGFYLRARFTEGLLWSLTESASPP
ncbi:MAG: DNA mismatch repair endonuclease MutH [Deltaproteobacteria bacterium]|nr:DNA mismatch repair endonuclease MutH [Deltaproteobacteria bacterium]